MAWIYPSGTASLKCHSTAECLQEQLAVKTSSAEDRGLQTKAWLRKGCAKLIGKGDFLSNTSVWVLGRALHVLINSRHLTKCSVIIYLLRGSPGLWCCCLAVSKELLGLCAHTAGATSYPHQPCTGKKELFQVHFSDVSEESSTLVLVSHLQGHTQMSASRAKAWHGKHVSLIGFTWYLSCQKEY